jgi:ubiquinone/menaquinone biosynthesis C-methylase UbiE
MKNDASVEHTIPGGYQLEALLRGWRFQRAWHRARLDLVASLLPPRSGSLALDAAAGSGILTWRFPAERIVNADMRLSACRSVVAHTPSALAVAGKVTALPFRDAVFSQVYFLEAIEHLSERDGSRVLAELRRVSRPDARCLITTPNYRSYWVLLERALDALRLTPAMAEAQHQSRYDVSSLRRAIQSGGWRIARLGSFNLLAPFVGTVSRRAGARMVDFEAGRTLKAGALLYALCEPE